MKMRASLLAGLALALLCACSTTSGPSPHDVKLMGKPEVVYLQTGPDLMVLNSQVATEDAFRCWPLAGMLGALLCGAVQKAREADRESKVSAKQPLLRAYAGQIRAFDFHARTLAMFDSAVADAPWLAGQGVHRVLWNDDEVEYTRSKGGDTVVYIQPIFALDPYSNSFLVEVLVGIQKFDPTYPDEIHNFRKLQFSFSHQPLEPQPGMDGRQRDAVIHQAWNMDSAKAMQLWFADDAALLKADFAKDLQEVQKSVREMLGSR